MKEEILKEIKDAYYKDVELRDKYIKEDKQIKKLETTRDVIKYLKLLKERTKRIYSIDSSTKESKFTLLYKEFCNNKSKIKETNRIYICMATYTRKYENNEIIDEKVEYNSPKAEYSTYKDIENENEVLVPIKFRKEFAIKNNIIIPKSSSNEMEYCHLQEQFLEDCVSLSQEEAVNKILKLKK